MKLDIKDNETVELLMLEVGQCFKLNNKYYMKVLPVKTSNFTYTAVNLENGNLVSINDLTKVELMDLVCIRN